MEGTTVVKLAALLKDTCVLALLAAWYEAVGSMAPALVKAFSRELEF